MSVSTAEESSQMVLWNSLLWMELSSLNGFVTCTRAAEFHWEGAPEVIKLRAQQEPGRDNKTVTTLSLDMGII